MSTNTVRNQSEGVEIRVTSSNGSQQSIAHVGYTIRPRASLSINVDVFDEVLVASNIEMVKASVNEFIAEAFAKAAEVNIPVGE